jgi:hypothetical protein
MSLLGLLGSAGDSDTSLAGMTGADADTLKAAITLLLALGIELANMALAFHRHQTQKASPFGRRQSNNQSQEYFTTCLAMSELSLPTMTRNPLPRQRVYLHFLRF